MADVIANSFVVDVKTTKADVIACYISLLLADVVASIFVADVITTYYSIRRCLFWLMLLPCVCVVDVITTEADYLHWESNHFFTAKNSVYNILAFKAKVVCTSKQALHKEMKHIWNSLQACNFPPLTLFTLQHKSNSKQTPTMDK